MQTQTHERRRFSRIPFEGKITLSLAGRSWSANLIDISLKGLLVHVEDDFPYGDGSPIAASIVLSDTAMIGVIARIVHRAENQVGMDIINVDVEGMSHLRRLIELNLGDEAAAERELSELIALHGDLTG